VVRRKGIPVHVSPQVMIELRLISPDGILEIPDEPHKVGAKIKAISGIFKGDEGVVTKLVPARERVRVLFEILGRPTEVEIGEQEVDFPSAHPIGNG
jgi:transcription antitermination factor NusG